MKDWRFMPQESDWCETRMRFTEDKDHLHNLVDIPMYYAPELLIEPEDDKARDDLYDEAPGLKYAYGYNADQGDTGIWLKMKQYYNNRPH